MLRRNTAQNQLPLDLILPYSPHHPTHHEQTIQRIPNYVGPRAVRPSNRNQEGTKRIRPIPKGHHGRRFHHVSILHLPAPLPKQRSGRHAHQTREKYAAAKRQRGYTLHHRQTIWRYGNLFMQKTMHRQTRTAAIRAILTTHATFSPQIELKNSA